VLAVTLAQLLEQRVLLLVMQLTILLSVLSTLAHKLLSIKRT
jgi:hypothetical protein